MTYKEQKAVEHAADLAKPFLQVQDWTKDHKHRPLLLEPVIDPNKALKKAELVKKIRTCPTTSYPPWTFPAGLRIAKEDEDSWTYYMDGTVTNGVSAAQRDASDRQQEDELDDARIDALIGAAPKQATHAEDLKQLVRRVQNHPEDKEALAALLYSVFDDAALDIFPDKLVGDLIVNDSFAPEDLAVLIKSACKMVEDPLNDLPWPDPDDHTESAEALRSLCTEYFYGVLAERKAAAEAEPKTPDEAKAVYLFDLTQRIKYADNAKDEVDAANELFQAMYPDESVAPEPGTELTIDQLVTDARRLAFKLHHYPAVAAAKEQDAAAQEPAATEPQGRDLKADYESSAAQEPPAAETKEERLERLKAAVPEPDSNNLKLCCAVDHGNGCASRIYHGTDCPGAESCPVQQYEDEKWKQEDAEMEAALRRHREQAAAQKGAMTDTEQDEPDAMEAPGGMMGDEGEFFDTAEFRAWQERNKPGTIEASAQEPTALMTVAEMIVEHGINPIHVDGLKEWGKLKFRVASIDWTHLSENGVLFEGDPEDTRLWLRHKPGDDKHFTIKPAPWNLIEFGTHGPQPDTTCRPWEDMDSPISEYDWVKANIDPKTQKVLDVQKPEPIALVFNSLAEYKRWAACASLQEREAYWDGLSDLDFARLIEDLDKEEKD